MINKFFKTSLPIAWMALIFYLSNQPYDFFVIGPTSAEQSMAHVFLYTVLSFLIVNAVIGLEKKWQIKNIILFSIFFSIFYGITDEFHQGFVQGRFVSYLDLLFDTIGALVGSFLYLVVLNIKKPKLLLHICCIGCGAYIIKNLKKKFRIVLYFYNPNVFPEDEYNKRLEESKRIAKKFRLKIMVGEYSHDDWLKLVKGLEREPERGKRCALCYRERLVGVAKKAENMNFDYFATTLTISPHKDAKVINSIGNELQEKYNIKYLDKDFKKGDGFKKTCELSKELGLYRQSYCGCEFSMSHNR